MTVKVRSSKGDSQVNQSTLQLDAPEFINVDDLIVVVLMIDDDRSQTLTPPTDFNLDGQVFSTSMGSAGTRFMLYSKRAVAADNSNQDTADYYDFSGMNGSDDVLYGIFSLYDDGGELVNFVAGSLLDEANAGGGTSDTMPGHTILNDGSLGLVAAVARDGTSQYQIDVNESWSPTGGANTTFHHGGWVDQAFGGSEWVVATSEFDVADSPTGDHTLTHNALASDVDVYAISALYQPAASGVNDDDIGAVAGGVQRGIQRGIM